MANFKPGQKVVFIGTYKSYPGERLPKIETEICEIVGINKIDGVYALKGYEIDNDGDRQYFFAQELRPLHDVLSEQSDFDLWKIEQEINEAVESLPIP